MDDPPRETPITITPDMLAPARPATGAPGGGGGRDRQGRIDFERGMRRLPPLVSTLIIANIAIFAWEVMTGAFASLADRKALIEAGATVANAPSILEMGALVRERVLAGEWWRTITAMFLHGGPDHLIGNMVVLFIVGMACEHAFGVGRTALVYFGSGIAGAALSMAMGPGPSVGASGAIFGVLAAVVVVLYRHQDRFYLRDKRIGFVLAIWAGWQILTGFLTPYIDNFAHLGGLAGGAAAALILSPRLTAVPRGDAPARLRA
ncbi:MAG: rhomboid family intramembrane serine protease [Gemmatimonadales bacterium]